MIVGAWSMVVALWQQYEYYYYYYYGIHEFINYRIYTFKYYRTCTFRNCRIIYVYIIIYIYMQGGFPAFWTP